MQIFLPYLQPLQVAGVLDPRRLNKQILECDWMLHAKEGSHVKHHPIYKMYKDNLDFVAHYRDCLYWYKHGEVSDAITYNNLAMGVLPEFLKNAQWYFDNFKRRLYTKDPEFYWMWSVEGESYSNFYYVDGEWKEYEN